jgi:hypothetical protein
MVKEKSCWKGKVLIVKLLEFEKGGVTPTCEEEIVKW